MKKTRYSQKCIYRIRVCVALGEIKENPSSIHVSRLWFLLVAPVVTSFVSFRLPFCCKCNQEIKQRDGRLLTLLSCQRSAVVTRALVLGCALRSWKRPFCHYNRNKQKQLETRLGLRLALLWHIQTILEYVKCEVDPPTLVYWSIR